MAWVAVKLIKTSTARHDGFNRWRANCEAKGAVAPGDASALLRDVLSTLPDIDSRSSVLFTSLLLWSLELAALLPLIIAANAEERGSIRGTILAGLFLFPSTVFNTSVLGILQEGRGSADRWSRMLYRRRYVIFMFFHLLTALAITTPLLAATRPESSSPFLMPAGIVENTIVVEFAWSTLILLFSPLFGGAGGLVIFPLGLPFWSVLLVALVLWILRMLWWVLGTWGWLAAKFHLYSKGEVTSESSDEDLTRHVFIPISFFVVGFVAVGIVLKKVWPYM